MDAQDERLKGRKTIGQVMRLVRKKIGRGYGGWSDKRVNGRSFKVLGWGIDEWLIAQRIFEVEGYKTRIRRSPPQSYNGVDVGSKLRLWVNY